MDFFERQDQARRRTRGLIAYFITAILLIVLAVYLVVVALFFREEALEAAAGWWHPKAFLISASATLSIIGVASLFKIVELRRGGSVVAEMLGGRRIDPGTADPDERQLLNVVEEMAIASGTPVPEVYVLEEEKGINAFAAGFTLDDAAIGVTRGALGLLSRDELQGVIAHEFSHILNGDMRLNIRLVGLLFGILAIAVIGRVILRAGAPGRRASGGKKGGGKGGAILLLALALVVIGYLGVLFARLIQSAVSRQREYLADAAAVQFTRNPAGLTGALKKIGGLIYGSRLGAAQAEGAAHLFFGNGLGTAAFSWMSTHPPLAKRIQAIDPSFDGEFPKVIARKSPPAAPSEGAAPAGQRNATAQSVSQFGGDAAAELTPASEIISLAGTISLEHLAYAGTLLDSIPEMLRNAAHQPLEATALICAMLMSADDSVRKTQLDLLETHAPPETLRLVRRFFPAASALDARARLPLAELAVPALRELSGRQFDDFKANLRRLIESDRQIALFEFALEKLLVRQLEPHFRTVPRKSIQYYSYKAVTHECEVLLSALAHAGHRDAEARAKAYAVGAAKAEIKGLRPAALPFVECNLPQIDAALTKLAQASPAIKKSVLQACAYAAATDGQVQAKEAELLRAMADTLECPVPPFLR